MDILLTHGYFLDGDTHERSIMKPYPPLGILYLSAYLKERGFEVGVYDATFGSLTEFESLLRRVHPAAVGIYGTLMTKSGLLAMLRRAKAAGSIVILGGPEPAEYAGEYLGRGADVIVYGEGETALEELLPACDSGRFRSLEGIAGIAFRREDGSVVRTGFRPLIRDLDTLPDPDREAIAMSRYLEVWRAHHDVSSVSLICARGCRYRCTWCSHSVYGNTHRRRTPGRVAAEVQKIIARYHPDQLWYADDVFTVDHRWLFEYAGELARMGIRIPFECISRADRLGDEVIALLSDMGCRRLWLGSESGSQRILDAMRSGVKVEQVKTVVRTLKRRGIQTGMFVMLGYDGEEMQDLKETRDHILECSPDVVLTTVAYPIKGTEYFEKLQDRIFSPAEWDNRTDRDLGIRGRHSSRYYSFASRWMLGSAALRSRHPGRNPVGMAKSAANTIVGRVGMFVTRKETEEDRRGRKRTAWRRGNDRSGF